MRDERASAAEAHDGDARAALRVAITNTLGRIPYPVLFLRCCRRALRSLPRPCAPRPGDLEARGDEGYAP
jgi:hypothetical protein